jgi:hypothetical protein
MGRNECDQKLGTSSRKANGVLPGGEMDPASLWLKKAELQTGARNQEKEEAKETEKKKKM